jgi:DNA-binding NarL/FixJ family response regulator
MDAASEEDKGRIFGRKLGERPKSDRLAPKVISLLDEGRSYRFIARELGLSPTTVMAIAKRHREPT